jgi:hypothetical protein
LDFLKEIKAEEVRSVRRFFRKIYPPPQPITGAGVRLIRL